MPYVLDTNVAIHIRDQDPDITAKIAALDDAIFLSVITRIELESGVFRDPAQSARRRIGLDLLLAGMPVIALDEAAADGYRRIIEASGYSRRKLLDRMIAAQCLVIGATLVTLNADDFRDVPGLKLLAW